MFIELLEQCLICNACYLHIFFLCRCHDLTSNIVLNREQKVNNALEMHFVYFISTGEAGLLPHFSDEHTEAWRQILFPEVQQGHLSYALVRACLPHWLAVWTRVLEGPTGRGLSVRVLPGPQKSGWGAGSTWRAAETEKPTRPALRRALLSTAHVAAANTSPFPRSSRLAASHLQAGAGSSGVSGGLSVGPASLGTRTGHGSSPSSAHGGPGHGLLHTQTPPKLNGWDKLTLSCLTSAQLRVWHTVGALVKLCHAANSLCVGYAKPHALVLP